MKISDILTHQLAIFLAIGVISLPKSKISNVRFI